ncbi:hypothetical protein T281_03385 [Rhodomicrobium udaipurense JA643]|uniref:TonB-dependent hemoglobin/transferrin/lactoferrin family receptor n=1 Tax=Rhodomicrobium udaipurense TaxID=1202716 RepID=A0A8I1GFI7_9HYPH|nr:TonB-dependent hemoglobin/transferrin/lactoferrin family receptor [Rhodomicrobium udaipurense]KAI95826.1 hypothetical protein T281_03385 [Rhodomicrobium udaipurense JA643]MBJ7543638.1 TonB-dependent hemoglobin/transferrin/lactoferrin family receptor [Rhodomicrobium udaipurense]
MTWGSRAAYAAAVALSASTLLSASAFSQDEAGQRVQLDEISIFATLNPIAAFDYPGQVSVVQKDQIEIEQPTSISDVLKSIPGVYVGGGPRIAGQDPQIRGFTGQDILVLVDGVRQSFESGHKGRIFLDPDLLKQVEVIKGPSSALYGSGALGGVIAMTTVDAADLLADGETAGFKIKMGGQSASQQALASATVFTRSEDKTYDVVANFGYRRVGDLELGNGTTLPNTDDIKSALVKGSVQITPDLKFTGTYTHFLDNGPSLANPQGNNVYDATTNKAVNRRALSDMVSGKLSYAPAGSPWFDGNLRVYWEQNHLYENYNISNTVREAARNVETVGVDIDNRSRFDLASLGAKVTLTYGADYHTDRQAGNDSCPVGSSGCGTSSVVTSTASIPSAEASYGGTFAQAEFKFDRPLSLPGEATLIPGVRFDTFSMNATGHEDFTDEAISPKIAGSYKPVPWFQVFGSYGEAFRAPTYNELYAQGNHFTAGYVGGIGLIYNRFKANPDLKPQEGQTAEGGAAFEFKNLVQSGDQLRIKGSYWNTTAQNYINQEVISDGCVSNPALFDQSKCYTWFFNVPNAELSGAEIELTYDSHRFFGGVGYSTMTGKDTETNEYLGALQPDKVILNAGVKVPEIWSRFGARYTIADQFTQTSSSSSYRSGYDLVDLYMVLEPTEGPFKGFRVDLGVDNITDQAYQVVDYASYEEGINFKGAVSWTVKW